MLRTIFGLFAAAALLCTCGLSAAEPHSIRVDCGEIVGVVWPLHGVNGGPLNQGETVDLTKYWRELGVPITRLHDCEWPSSALVDMHAVFPDLSADAQAPKSYRFAPTDEYLRPIVTNGTRIVYRLGESIEHTRRKHHVAPPADYGRWSEACLGIIRHNNEGWADGFRHGIEYWEIWNEPENRPAMWTGDDEAYYRLYASASRAIKEKYPKLKVGGPSVGAIGDVVDGTLRPTKFLAGFARYCRDHSLPLDFFSWHTYTDKPHEYLLKARAVRRWLDEQGFPRTEIHLNEWNFLPANDWRPMIAGQGDDRRKWYETMGGSRGAAFVAYVLAELQDSPVAVANYYSGDSSPFGLFDRYGTPKKTYFAMKAFRMLLDTSRRVKSDGGAADQFALCAGVNERQTTVTLLVSHYRGEVAAFDIAFDRLPWSGTSTCSLFRVDDNNDLELVEEREFTGPQAKCRSRIESPGVAVVRLEAKP